MTDGRNDDPLIGELARMAEEIRAISLLSEGATSSDGMLLQQLVQHLLTVLDALLTAGSMQASAMPWWREWDGRPDRNTADR